MPQVKTRQHADSTRKKILHQAKKLFAKNGFNGTSMESIAKAAKINQSLIFHHFKNKQHLWTIIKQEWITEKKIIPVQMTTDLYKYLTEIVTTRYQMYKSDPEFVRLMLWQRLENPFVMKSPDNPLSPLNWMTQIEYLQSNKIIRQDINAKHIMLMVIGLIDSVISLPMVKLNESEEQNYIHDCTRCLFHFLKNTRC